MRRLIDYLRQCFCKHDWHVEEGYAQYQSNIAGTAEGDYVYMRSKKCGYHKLHWKLF